MPNQFIYQPFNPQNPDHIQAVVRLWNAACGQALAISTRFVAHNTRPATGEVQQGRLAVQGTEPVAFILASALPDDPLVSSPEQGWINAITVAPQAQRQGIGSALLEWAETWLIRQGCRFAALGGSLRPFAPGLPTELKTLDFFAQRGYNGSSEHRLTWDVAANLATYTSPPTVRPIDGVARPAQPGDEQALLRFLQREFPNRWRFEFEEFLRGQGRISDYMLLWTERGIDGFCQLSFADSLRPLERFYPYGLPRPWGQLGPIGVSEDRRGRGYGAALLDAGLRRLQNNGVNGCVIDWTGIVDFYGKFGFARYREYVRLHKAFSDQGSL